MKFLFSLLTFTLLALDLFAQYNREEDEAMRLYQSGDFKAAAEAIGKLYNKSNDRSYFDLYMNALLKSKQYTEAEKLTKRLSRQQPQSLQYKIALARIYKQSGNDENAAKAYKAILDDLPKDELVIRETANQLYQLGEQEQAIAVLQEGRKLMGNSLAFGFELLSLYRFKRDKIGLVQEYLNALATTPTLLSQAQSVLAGVFDAPADYLMLQTSLLKKIQKEPDNETYGRLLAWQYLQQQDYDMALRQLIALDKRTKGDGSALYEHARIFAANKSYATAERAYTYLLNKGKENTYYLPSRLGLLEVRQQLVNSGNTDLTVIKTLASDYQSIIVEYGKNARTVFALRQWASLQAYELHDLPQAEAALESTLRIPGISPQELASIKLELADIYVLNNEPWEALLSYGQVAKEFENQNIGNDAQYRSARVSFYQGNFTYAKAQADVLKTSTTQLIANDALNLSLLISDHLANPTDTPALKMYADAGFLEFKNRPDAALRKLDSITLVYPGSNLGDDILMAKSRIQHKSGRYNEAVKLLEVLVSSPQKDIWTDDALFLLAGIYEEQLGQKEKAKVCYQRLITDFPGSMFAAEARKHYRKLRGDDI